MRNNKSILMVLVTVLVVIQAVMVQATVILSVANPGGASAGSPGGTCTMPYWGYCNPQQTPYPTNGFTILTGPIPISNACQDSGNIITTNHYGYFPSNTNGVCFPQNSYNTCYTYTACSSDKVCSTGSCTSACPTNDPPAIADCKSATNHICSIKSDGTSCHSGSGQCSSGTCCIKGTPTGTSLPPTGYNCCSDSVLSGGKCYSGCIPGNEKPCDSQEGICSGATQTCDAAGNWPGCSAATYTAYNSKYEQPETSCDGVDNDCDGEADKNCKQSNLLFYTDEANAKFRSCNLGTAKDQIETFFNYPSGYIYNFPTPNIGYTTTKDSSQIIDEVTCKNLGSWYCDVDSLWKDAYNYSLTDFKTKAFPTNDTKDTSTLKNAPTESNIYAQLNIKDENACCPSNYCYNGSGRCEPPYSDPQKSPIKKTYGDAGYRCSEKGQWNLVTLKFDFNLEKTGYCNEETECYAESPENPNGKCYKDGEFGVFNSVDRMCSNGKWTTRTKYIASALANYAFENNYVDYTLYCDSPERALGLQTIFAGDQYEGINYNVGQNNFNNYILDNYYCGGNKCINNVCVLSFGNNVIIGTSLNRRLNNTEYPLHEAFGFDFNEDYQHPVFTTGNEVELEYESAESGKLFYSNRSQVIFYSIDTSVPDFDESITDNIVNIITSPFTSLSNYIKTLIAGDVTQNTDVINKAADFDRIYLAHKTFILPPKEKSIIGMQETKFDSDLNELRTFISINYTGFDSNICDAVQASNILPNSACNDSISGTSYVFDSNINPDTYDSIWQDLTAKIRLK